jgi:hypothetical protein
MVTVFCKILINLLVAVIPFVATILLPDMNNYTWYFLSLIYLAVIYVKKRGALKFGSYYLYGMYVHVLWAMFLAMMSFLFWVFGFSDM